MASDSLNSLIDQLKRVQLDIPNSSIQFEQTLELIFALQDPDCIPLLVMCLDDDCGYQELMFSIVHLVENFESEVYVSKVLQVTDKLCVKASEWAETLHLRIWNNESCFLIYLDALRTIEPSRKEFLLTLFQRLGKRNVKFEERSLRAISALNH